MKAGKVVVMLTGRFAGCKAVVLKVQESSDDRKAKGAKGRNTLVVCGLAETPKSVTKKLLSANAKLTGDQKIAADRAVNRRSRVKTFVKQVNFTHVMPTRYNVDLHEELAQKLVGEEALKGPEERRTARKAFKEVLEKKYAALGSVTDGKAQKHTMYFFKKCVGAARRRAAAAPLPPRFAHAPAPSLTPLLPHPPPSLRRLRF